VLVGFDVSDLRIVLFVAGAALVTAAATLFLLPVGLAVAGVCCFAALWLLR
jgi:hypothetical protein